MDAERGAIDAHACKTNASSHQITVWLIKKVEHMRGANPLIKLEFGLDNGGAMRWRRVTGMQTAHLFGLVECVKHSRSSPVPKGCRPLADCGLA
jgi:hypothetical protein